jgi:spore coat polysaccharide biosynthesis predicted glycosyltransferase SpsG
MKETIIIKTDGSNEIGLGHIYRSVNLAKELKKRNYKIIFLTKSSILTKIIPKTFTVKKIKNNLNELQNVLNKINPKIIIIDKLEENLKEIKILSEKSILVAIDYTGKNKKEIKFGINLLYHKSGIQGKNSFSGFNLTILSDSIRKKKPIKIVKKVKKIFVIQGGTDTPCNTPKIIDALNKINEDIQINIVVGLSFKCWKTLNESIRNSVHDVKIFHNIKNIGEIMQKSDIAITGGGMTSLELCHLGVPSIIICGASFENETSSLLEKNGFGINLGYNKKISEKKVGVTVKKLMVNYQQRKEMQKIGQKLIDGNGVKRVANIILRMIK